VVLGRPLGCRPGSSAICGESGDRRGSVVRHLMLRHYHSDFYHGYGGGSPGVVLRFASLLDIGSGSRCVISLPMEEIVLVLRFRACALGGSESIPRCIPRVISGSFLSPGPSTPAST